MSDLHSFHCFAHPTRPDRAVKDGLCWVGFIVPPVWMIYERLWGWLALYLTAFWGLSLLSAGIWLVPYPVTRFSLLLTMNALHLALGAVVLLYGNRWIAARLRGQGYQWFAHVLAESPSRAAEAMADRRHQPPVGRRFNGTESA